MIEKPVRTPEEEALELRKDARHEAGHAVAALHYNCEIKDLSIGGEWPVRGTTKLGVSHTSHAVVLFSGPLAECEWDAFPAGKGNLSPADLVALAYLELSEDECVSFENEAIAFLEQLEVRQQIDRVADALRDQITLTVEKLREASGFSVSLRPGAQE